MWERKARENMLTCFTQSQRQLNSCPGFGMNLVGLLNLPSKHSSIVFGNLEEITCAQSPRIEGVALVVPTALLQIAMALAGAGTAIGWSGSWMTSKFHFEAHLHPKCSRCCTASGVQVQMWMVSCLYTTLRTCSLSLMPHCWAGCWGLASVSYYAYVRCHLSAARIQHIDDQVWMVLSPHDKVGDPISGIWGQGFIPPDFNTSWARH